MASSNTPIVVLGVGLALGVVAWIAAASASANSPASPTPAPTPPAGGGPKTLKAGERYALTLHTPLPVPAADVATAQGVLDAMAPGIAHVVEASPAFQVPTTSATYTIDMLQDASVPDLRASLAASNPGVVVTIVDLGPTPVGATPPSATPPGGGATATPATPGTPAPTSPAGGVLPPPPPAVNQPATPSPVDQNRALLAAGTASWQLGGQVTAPGRGRATISNAHYSHVVGIGFGPGGRVGFESFLGGSGLPALVGQGFLVWAPGDALPPDWPADDPEADTGWHFEFVSQNAAKAIGGPELTSALGDLPVRLWVAQGSGPTAATRPSPLAWQTTDQVHPVPGSPGGQIQPGDHVRLTLAAADVVTIANAVGFTQFQTASCGAFLTLVQFTGFDQVLTGGTPHVLAWCGIDFLPPDWPAADNLSQYHLEFRFAGSSSVLLASLPFPVMGAWVAIGQGA